MELLIGTTNSAKQEEFRRIIGELGKKHHVNIQLFFPQDFSIVGNLKETGKTFEENSRLKAKFYFEKTQIPTIADDGGIVIDALHGEPGVKSHRWLGKDCTDEELIQYTLKRMKHFPDMKDRTAAFIVTLTYYDGENVFQETDKLKGHIAQVPSNFRVAAFPYRSLFIMPNGKYYYDLTEAEHEKYNHRQKALNKLFHKIMKPQIVV